MPLPACIEVKEGQEGACPSTNDNVTGSSVGRLATGGAVTVGVAPLLPVCDYHCACPPYPWTPGPCYSAVHDLVVVSCGYIDLENLNA